MEFALDQARILVQYLESGGRDADFLSLHALALLQTVSLESGLASSDPVPNARYVA